MVNPIRTECRMSMEVPLVSGLAGGGRAARAAAGFSRGIQYGSSAGQANQIGYKEIELAASADTTIDLTALSIDGPLESMAGSTMALSELHFIGIEVAGDGTDGVTVEKGATNGLADLFGTSGAPEIKPGEWLSSSRTLAISGTTKTILLTNTDSGEAATVRLCLLGR